MTTPTARSGLRLLVATTLALACAPAHAAAQDVPVRLFFDWDAGFEERNGPALFDRLAAQVLSRSPQAIEIVGHSDRSGGHLANRRRSAERARFVRDQLVRRGVGSGLIHLRAAGEDEPLVPTADGVREVQNRRVEIFVRP